MRDSSLMYTCSLIEVLGRLYHLRRGAVVSALEREGVARIYNHAGVLHAEPIEAVADEYAQVFALKQGAYDNVGSCRYHVPDYWSIGEVFERLIIDVCEGDIIDATLDVYGSWMCDAISDYNSDLYYQSRDYLRECYRAGEVLAE